MTKRMLIDATHPEETRVAVINGTKLEEYDFETLIRRQLKSNIYLVKVTRVEPSLQAAFVDFGGNRHGFLPFPEIHPDYYRIPIADRQALIEEERAIAAAQAAREDEEDRAELEAAGESLEEFDLSATPATGTENDDDGDDVDDTEEYVPQHTGSLAADMDQSSVVDDSDDEEEDETEAEHAHHDHNHSHAHETTEVIAIPMDELVAKAVAAVEAEDKAAAENGTSNDDDAEEEENVELIGGDSVDQPVFRSSIKRRYKIQEVIKRNQIMLIQISKEERGNKGAAVTSYISLPGRYCVLMPNSPRGGGVSRKVSNAKDRQRLKLILRELNVPEGMSVILRTAGVSRSKAEIKRDLDYLLRLWDQIREFTLKSTAPALIYEEGNLIKRAIRDLYRRDIDEVHVAGDEGYKNARDFMRTLMPSHAARVHPYTEENMPLFFRYQVESQIDEIHNPTVHLRSGGYIVINPTEAMVSIDVNSGKATKGRHIEETALKTNLEAADEVARQLRLRDQGGLIVIDFIDMEDKRNNRIVEKRLRDAMQNDRARIQLGRISAFGLLELSRQRLHPSLVESNFEVCKHCQGSGLVRTVETAGVIVLRAIEQEAMKSRSTDIKVGVPTEIALFIFNHKRDMLASIEKRYDVRILVHANDTLRSPNFDIAVVRVSAQETRRQQRPSPVQSVDISDLPDIPEDEITDDSTISEDEDRDIREIDDNGDEDGSTRRPHGDRNGGGRDGGRGGDRNASADGDNKRRGRRGGRRRGGRDRADGDAAAPHNGRQGSGRDQNRDRNRPAALDANGVAVANLHEAPQPDYAYPQHATAEEGRDTDGAPLENIDNVNGAAEGQEGGAPTEGRRDRNRGRRGGRNRGRRERGGAGGDRNAGGRSREPQQEGSTESAGSKDDGEPREAATHRPRDTQPANNSGNENSNAAEGSNDSDDAGNGNRKGWWKRLTE